MKHQSITYWLESFKLWVSPLQMWVYQNGTQHVSAWCSSSGIKQHIISTWASLWWAVFIMSLFSQVKTLKNHADLLPHSGLWNSFFCDQCFDKEAEMQSYLFICPFSAFRFFLNDCFDSICWGFVFVPCFEQDNYFSIFPLYCSKLFLPSLQYL